MLLAKRLKSPLRKKIDNPEASTAVCRRGVAILPAMSTTGIITRFGRLVSSCYTISVESNTWRILPSIGDTARPGRFMVSDMESIASNEMNGILPLPESKYFIVVKYLIFKQASVPFCFSSFTETEV